MRVMVMAGTRPEAVKMAPVIRALRQRPGFSATVCASGQHREMLAQAFADFGIQADINLDVMTAGQGLGALSSLLFARFDALFASARPDWLLVQGDTTSVMAAAICAFYHDIRVGHVEAGLRSFNRRSPFPEEINRKAVALVADLHFAPTEAARQNLLAEGVASGDICLTGNTVVDALNWRLAMLADSPAQLPANVAQSLASGRKIILLTAHRRENHGEPLRAIFSAVASLAQSRPDLQIIYPVHLNPAVNSPAKELLSGIANIALCEPLPYPALLTVLSAADLVMTDSGGIQEEACALGKPFIVLRENTERMEGIQAGCGKLVGARPERIISEALNYLAGGYGASDAGKNLYGDGRAAEKIADALASRASGRAQAGEAA